MWSGSAVMPSTTYIARRLLETSGFRTHPGLG